MESSDFSLTEYTEHIADFYVVSVDSLCELCVKLRALLNNAEVTTNKPS